MRTRRERLIDSDWPCWFFSPNGDSAIFQSASEVPPGWTNHKEEVYEVPSPQCHDSDDLRAQLSARGIEPLGFWSDAYMKELLDND
jgi:hypothetical protein